MSLTARNGKALKWYMETNKLRPALMTPPSTMNFIDQEGNDLSVELESIMLQYSAWNEDDKKERAKQRRNEKNEQANRVRLI